MTSASILSLLLLKEQGTLQNGHEPFVFAWNSLRAYSQPRAFCRASVPGTTVLRRSLLPVGYKAHLCWHNSQIWYPKKHTVSAGSPHLSSDHTSGYPARPSSTYQGQHTQLGSWERSHNTGMEQHIQIHCAAPAWRLARCCLTAHFALTHTFDAEQFPFYVCCGLEWLSHFH